MTAERGMRKGGEEAKPTHERVQSHPIRSVRSVDNLQGGAAKPTSPRVAMSKGVEAVNNGVVRVSARLGELAKSMNNNNDDQYCSAGDTELRLYLDRDIWGRQMNPEK
eukprot:CAMPEP_0185845040 /NCGR_PEP_ID=MMETSP1354-20130828/1104_1 /TAXON_ID=708628 /ORGANISM="Erythrolobus madagascarensis, Strain CCMP3276" /LENGTH=107 /DNA_ID=CAMNT_0028544895 /DNA_START=158 /DNA_END=481 /DNA_ORIENTATION=+